MPILPPVTCSASSGREGEALTNLLQSILQDLKTECEPLLEATLVPQGTLRIFDFLGNSVLEEVQATLAAELPGMSRSSRGQRMTVQSSQFQLSGALMWL
jgi:hypothetical protein